MTRILIAEDEPHITRFLVKGLQAEGYATTAAADGEEALHLARSGEFDLMLLDLGLPRQDGLHVLGEIRRAKLRLPVILVTARGSADDIVTGLDSGADDYLAKPFRIAELLARVRARLRHPAADEAATLVNGDLILDLRTRQAHVGDRVVDLSAREFALAETFLRHPGQVLSREQLLSRVWGYDYDPGSNVVDVYVRYLRAKLGQDRIATLRGAGYRLVKAAAPSP
jgi:two-component system, OmpR family, copper resistance phosphate regulon response regulator CusR